MISPSVSFSVKGDDNVSLGYYKGFVEIIWPMNIKSDI